MPQDSAGHWIDSKSVPMRVTGRDMMIAIPRAVLRQQSGRIALRFHWTDNIQRLGDINEFLFMADSAPGRRAIVAIPPWMCRLCSRFPFG